MAVKNLSKILKPYSNKWVALSEKQDKVVGSGNSVREALELAKKKGEDRPIITRVPKDYGNYILSI